VKDAKGIMSDDEMESDPEEPELSVHSVKQTAGTIVLTTMGKEVNEAELKLAKAEREDARQVVVAWISKFERDNGRKPDEADVGVIGTDLAEYNDKNAKYCELKLL